MIQKITWLWVFLLVNSIHCKEPMIMLDPAGHTNFLGRKLKDGYERGATLHVAEELQKVLQINRNLNVIISRRAGEVVYPLQVASFANRLQVSLIINIHIYHTSEEKPKIHLYHLCYNPFTEFSASKPQPATFIPIDKAHLVNLKKSAALAKQLQHLLMQGTYLQQWDVFKPIGIPLKPLIGILAPAISIEIGTNDEKKLLPLIPLLAENILHLNNS